MTREEMTTGRMLRGLLADSMSVLVGWPKTRGVVGVSADKRGANAASRMKSIRSQIDFVRCICIGCLH